MKKTVFTGSAVAIVTPFKDGKIDFDKFGELCEFQIKNGTNAIVVCGTTGEASTMPDEEHLSAIEFVVKKVAKRIPVIAGVGSNDTVHAVELSKAAEKIGADALLSVTPYYNKASQRGLIMHYKAINDSVNIPIILYNVPSRTGVNINPATFADLAAMKNIVAVKECNIAQIPEVLTYIGDSLDIYSGEDGQVLPVMAFGGKGVISVMANILPTETNSIVKSFLDGDVNKCRTLQVRYTNLIKALFCDVNPIPVKAAMNLMGFEVGECRMPLCNMTDSMVAELRKVLESYKLVRGDL